MMIWNCLRAWVPLDECDFARCDRDADEIVAAIDVRTDAVIERRPLCKRHASFSRWNETYVRTEHWDIETKEQR